MKQLCDPGTIRLPSGPQLLLLRSEGIEQVDWTGPFQLGYAEILGGPEVPLPLSEGEPGAGQQSTPLGVGSGSCSEKRFGSENDTTVSTLRRPLAQLPCQAEARTEPDKDTLIIINSCPKISVTLCQLTSAPL